VLGKPEPRGSWHQFKESHNCTVIVERINGVDPLAQARPRASSGPKSRVLAVNDARSKVSETAMVPLEELPQQDGYNSAPWVSANGLTLYWQSAAKGEKQRSIWCAERKNADSLFSNARTLFSGSDPTLTGDELEMILLDGRNLSLATRKTKQDDFGQPRRIPELNGLGFLAAPCLSEDGLLLWADRIQDGKVEIVRFHRPTRDNAWGKPEVVKMPFIGSTGRFICVSPERGYGFFCVPDLLKDKSANNLVYLSTKDQGATFTNPVVVELPKEVVRGKFPRYVEATRELFFSGDLEEGGRARLFVIRNFDRSSLRKN
jgi:hypothetical protein